MKQLIILFVLAILIASCVLPESNTFEFNEPEFANMKEACEWINQNISYKKDAYDYWKLPQETLDDGNGDCEDQALLLMGIMNYQKGYTSTLLIIEGEGGNGTAHALVKHDGKVYDCTNGTVKGSTNYKILYEYSYNDAMYNAQYVKNY